MTDQPKPSDSALCPVCNGDNRVMPCAYPGEHPAGCLRNVVQGNVPVEADDSARWLRVYGTDDSVAWLRIYGSHSIGHSSMTRGERDKLSAIADELEHSRAEIARLSDAGAWFEFIKHGEQDHQDWLREALQAFVSGEPKPSPRGLGRHDAEIARLRTEIDALDNDVQKEGEALAAATQQCAKLEALLGAAACPNQNCEAGVIAWNTGPEQCQWCDERAKAIWQRAIKEHDHEWIDPSNEVVTAGGFRMCKTCGPVKNSEGEG